MQDLQVVDNFFDDFDFILQQANKREYFDADQFSFDTGEINTWPGKRTKNLFHDETLHDYIVNITKKKFSVVKHKGINLGFHKRYSEDNSKDWVHTDASEYALIVYLSKTNLDSGTVFYQGEEKQMTINFVQNRAIYFKGSYPHKSLLNYGKEDDCRLTLNGFFWI